MTLDNTSTGVAALLEIFSKNPAHFTAENGLIIINNPPPALLSSLNTIGASVDDEHDTLSFSGFVVNNVFTRDAFDRRVIAQNAQSDFLVIDFPGQAILQAQEELKSFGNGATEFLQTVDNRLSYFKLYNLLKSKEFADHHNDGEKEIIIYNSAKGILKIHYSVPPPLFSATIHEAVGSLLQALNNSLLKIYFRNSLFEFATGNTLTIEKIITEEHDIISAAKRDQELATKQFDFDKFRDALYIQKDKFFTSIRDLLSKIYGQIIGIPISITASVYAAYKIDHDAFVSVLVLISFMLYVVIYITTQYTYFKDIGEIKVDFERDFEVIRTKSGLPQETVKAEFDKILNKIKTAKNISLSLIFGIIALGACVVFFILNQLFKG